MSDKKAKDILEVEDSINTILDELSKMQKAAVLLSQNSDAASKLIQSVSILTNQVRYFAQGASAITEKLLSTDIILKIDGLRTEIQSKLLKSVETLSQFFETKITKLLGDMKVLQDAVNNIKKLNELLVNSNLEFSKNINQDIEKLSGLLNNKLIEIQSNINCLKDLLNELKNSYELLVKQTSDLNNHFNQNLEKLSSCLNDKLKELQADITFLKELPSSVRDLAELFVSKSLELSNNITQNFDKINNLINDASSVVFNALNEIKLLQKRNIISVRVALLSNLIVLMVFGILLLLSK